MPGVLLVGAEGVILLPDYQAYGASKPLMDGLELVMQLMHFPTTRTVVLTNQVETSNATYFCRLNGLAKVAVIGISAEDEAEDPALAQWYAIDRCRAQGPVNMVLTSHTEVFERCTSSHQPVLLFGRRGSLGTQRARPEWGDLHERVIRSREAVVDHQMEGEEDEEI